MSSSETAIDPASQAMDDKADGTACSRNRATGERERAAGDLQPTTRLCEGAA